MSTCTRSCVVLVYGPCSTKNRSFRFDSRAVDVICADKSIADWVSTFFADGAVSAYAAHVVPVSPDAKSQNFALPGATVNS